MAAILTKHEKLTIIGGTPEKWAALTERQKYGLDEPSDSEPGKNVG